VKTQGIAPVFRVSRLDESLKYYIDVLGFEEDFRFTNYAGVRLGEAAIHLGGGDNVHLRPLGGGTAYIFCDEVDAYYETIKGKGAIVKVAPGNWPYGMRDFTVVDPDENHLTFGYEAQKPSASERP